MIFCEIATDLSYRPKWSVILNPVVPVGLAALLACKPAAAAAATTLSRLQKIQKEARQQMLECTNGSEIGGVFSNHCDNRGAGTAPWHYGSETQPSDGGRGIEKVRTPQIKLIELKKRFLT